MVNKLTQAMGLSAESKEVTPMDTYECWYSTLCYRGEKYACDWFGCMSTGTCC